MLASEIPLSKTLLSYRVAELSSVFTRNRKLLELLDQSMAARNSTDRFEP